MKRTATLILFFTIAAFTKAQVMLRTIVPQQPVVVGESFQVQFVSEYGANTGDVIPPSFNGFRLVSGPQIYPGRSASNNNVGSINTVYTLQAVRPGRFLLQGAQIDIAGRKYRSGNVWISVMSRPQASPPQEATGSTAGNGNSYLKPGEDPYEKMNKNLFVKVTVNRKNCFTGQPVVATFRLFSRLNSRSEIVKNPGFYGFTVHDMINLDDRIATVESVGGSLYNVHTIRKVQLYPLQPGTFTIDPMEIRNKVIFSRSAVDKKPEQKIFEGAVGDNEPPAGPDGEIFENNMSTRPVTIIVKPAPEKNKPAVFNGATGHFGIDVSLEKQELARNEEGYLLVTIKGKGNFSQLSAPILQWPAGLEGFEPAVSDDFDKTKSPMEGSRSFRYAFVAAAAGVYHLPAISFTFFDPDTNKYKTVVSKEQRVVISSSEKTKPPVITGKKNTISDINKKASWIAAGIVLLLLISVITYWITRKKEPGVAKVEAIEEPRVSIDQLLMPAYLLMPAADRDFYSALHRGIWKYLIGILDLKTSNMAKHTLPSKLEMRGMTPASAQQLILVLERCEAAMFTNANLGDDKSELLSTVKMLLTEVKS